jgi:exopolysaccharide production protein ExoZ
MLLPSDGKPKSTPQHERFQTLQAARGLAAGMVVICHAAAFVGDEPTLWHRLEISHWLRGTTLGVQLFFVLSGIVIFAAHRKDLGRPSTLPSFLWKRFRRIYPLYWIFFLPTVVRHTAGIEASVDYQRNPWVIASGVVLVHLFSTQTNMVVAWTLFDEVLFYLCFALLLLNKRIGAVVFAFWMVASFFFMVPSGGYWFSIFSPNHLLFGLGMFVAWMLEKAHRPPARVFLWAGVVTFLTCVVLAGSLAPGEMAVRLVGGAGAASALYGAAIIERRGEWTVPHWLAFLGDASYSIYLAHFMVVSTVARICYARWHQLPVPIAIWMALFVLCGIGAGILTHLFIEKPLLAKLSRITFSSETHVSGRSVGPIQSKYDS